MKICCVNIFKTHSQFFVKSNITMTKRFFARNSITFINDSVGTSGRALQKSTVTPAVDFCLWGLALPMDSGFARLWA